MENIDEKIEAAKEAVKEIRQAKALASMPVADEKKEVRSKVYADVQNAIKEQRAVTLGGTGNVNVVRELFKKLTAKKEILQKVRYFYGPNASTVIPVWASDLGRAHEVGSAGTWTETDNPALAAKNLQVKPFGKTIPVSQETLKLSAVDFEAELDNILADVYADTIAYEMFNAAGTGAFKTIYNQANEYETKVKDSFTVTDLANFALKVKDKTDDAIIILTADSYAGITASDSSAKEKAWAKELIEFKKIEGVPVFLTSYADDTNHIAVACNPANYCVAVADELNIEPKKVAGSIITSFDATMYLAGENAVDKNVFVLNNKA